jgi:Ser/Thr protein kinase RdoA (MazF antagonist)
MAGLYDDAFIETLRRGAESLAPEWGLSDRTHVNLLTVSENATFRADDPARDAPVILRVHRPGYHTRAEIESELDWIEALRAEGVAAIPRPLPVRGGGHIAHFDLDGESREVVAFEFMSGEEPAPDEDLVHGFHELGAISARLHGHVKGWARPAGFVRKTWNFDTTVGPTPHWGDWRAALGLTADGQAVLERACVELKRRLDALRNRAGSVRADPRRSAPRQPAGRWRADRRDRLRRLRLRLVHVRLRRRDQLHRDRPADPRAAGRLGRRLSRGRAAGSRRTRRCCRPS